jgi:hypothetical protein
MDFYWVSFFVIPDFNDLVNCKIGKQIPIKSTITTLYPTISMHGNVSVEANFGDDLAMPFKYDINNLQHFELTGVKHKLLDVGQMV